MTDTKRGATSGGGGPRVPNILDRPLAAKGRGGGGSGGEVSLSAFSFLFSEMVQYYQSRVLSIADLERK